MRRPDGVWPIVTVLETGATLVPTRTVFVPPLVKREDDGIALKPCPEIEMADATGAETEERNSQTPDAFGWGFT